MREFPISFIISFFMEMQFSQRVRTLAEVTIATVKKVQVLSVPLVPNIYALGKAGTPPVFNREICGR